MGHNEVSLKRGPAGLVWRFWQKVEKTPTCWNWKGSTNVDGYGRFNVYLGPYKFKLVQAHRFSYELTNGEPDPSMYVLHKCDNPACVNPDHLFVGTQTDNMKDMAVKGRSNKKGPPTCHPDRPYHSRFMCKQCYLRWWHNEHK